MSAPVDPNLYRGWSFTPERARKRLAALNQNPADREAWLNKAHPLHQLAVEHRLYLNQVIAGEAPPEGSRPAPRPSGGKIPEARIFDAQHSPAYLDKRHPEHAAVVAEILAAQGELHPEPPSEPQREG